MRDLYDILGVSRDANAEAIRKAYRALVKRLHPDKNAGSEGAFQEVVQAYEVLGDDSRRQLYDKHGDIALNKNFKGFEGGSSGSGSFGAFNDFFSSFTDATSHGTEQYRGSGTESGSYSDDNSGWRSSYSRTQSPGSFSDYGFGTDSHSRRNSGFEPPQKGADIKLKLHISLVEACRGVDKKVTIRRPSRWVRGSNSGMQSETVTIEVHPGAQSGESLILKGKGNPGKGGGASGNLVATIDVAHHPYLHRDGDDLFLMVPLTLKEAIDGAKILVPTLTGSVRVRVPPGVTPGQKLRLKSRGPRKTSGGNGDLYLILLPTAPVANSDELRILAERLESFYPADGLRKDWSL